MKLALLVAALTASLAAALQGGYLDQFNNNNGVNNRVNSANVGTGGPGFGTAPPPSSSAGGGPSGGPSQELMGLWSKQVSVELSASQLYLSASIWFAMREYHGMAAWMLDESGEERDHGLAILDFANKRKFRVKLEVLPAPPSDWFSPTQVWEDILLAEQTNTQNLLNIAAVANQCGDYSAMAFLNPFHMEQVDAEGKVGSILAKVRDASPEFLRELDHELGMEAAGEEVH